MLTIAVLIAALVGCTWAVMQSKRKRRGEGYVATDEHGCPSRRALFRKAGIR